MPLYIANCTKQDRDFSYRTVKGGKLIMQMIKIGSQVKLAGDLTGMQITYIVQQHEKYGFTNVKDIDRTKAFIGICYDDKPIQVDAIRAALTHNDQVLIERGRKNREEAAVATNQAVNEQLEGAAGLDNLEFTIEEEDNGKVEGEPLLEEINVSKHAEGRTESSKPDGKKRSGGKKNASKKGR